MGASLSSGNELPRKSLNFVSISGNTDWLSPKFMGIRGRGEPPLVSRPAELEIHTNQFQIRSLPTEGIVFPGRLWGQQLGNGTRAGRPI